MAFRGKVALVTGAASGIGRLAARQLAAAGARVAALDVDAAGLAATAEGSASIHVARVDVTDAAAVQRAADDAERDLGPIDRVVHCAAIMPYARLLDQDVAVQTRVMTINYGGLVHVARATLPRMIARGSGDFVSFASMAGILPTMLTGAYSASKAAVITYTEILAHENRASGVRFACVCPPAVDTPLLEQGRSAWPKIVDQAGPPMQAADVLAEVERCLEKGRLLVLPGRQTRVGYLMRRLFPALVWKQIHDVEGF